jgi:hypothetical protein
MGLAASQTVVDLEKQLFGVWKLESFYTENKAGERRDSYGARPNGYGILTPEKRMMVNYRRAGPEIADHRRGSQCGVLVDDRVQRPLPRRGRPVHHQSGYLVE